MTPDDVLRTSRNDRDRYDVQCLADGDVFAELDDVLFAVPFGSHLYGTADEESDIDIKCVFVESFRRLVLEEDRETVRFSTSDEKVANHPGDIDVDCIELRKFVSDALEGQTYAVELLHCPDDRVIVETSRFRALRDQRGHLLSTRVQPFVGYCRTQARKYGAKGERLEAIETTLEVLERHDHSARLEEIVDELPLDQAYVDIVEQSIRGQDDPVALLEVVDKRYEMRARIEKAVESLRKVRDQYGERTRRARDGIDWKAISHAYRVVFELRELLSSGGLEFPLERADFLRRVKRGEVAYDRVQSEIPSLVEETMEMESVLPDTPDRSFACDWLVETYRSMAEEHSR